MEVVRCRLDAEFFDMAIHGGLDAAPVLPESGDLAFYIKPKATVDGNPAVVITFTVQQTDGKIARAQAVTTLANFESVFAFIRGCREGGRL